MRLPTIKKILREDLKDAPEYVNGIIGPVNSFMEWVYQALNKNISLADNISSFVREFTYTTSATYPADMVMQTFQNELRARATGVIIMQVVDKTNYIPHAATGVSWVELNGAIQIHLVTGLEASKTYTVRVVVF